MNARYRYPLYLFYSGRIGSEGPMECKTCHEEITRDKLRIHVVAKHLGLLLMYVELGKARRVEPEKSIGTWANIMLARLRAERGNKCFDCDTVSKMPEFHHIRLTGLKGMGRGSSQRAKDIRDNPDAYVLLCKSCHTARHKAIIREKTELQAIETRRPRHDNGY